MFGLAERLQRLPPYLFAELDAMKRKKLREGVKLIDFGVGDPDLPTPPHIVEAMKKAVEKVENQKYPSYEGMLSFREAVADFYKRRKGVDLDPEKEVIALIGSKEGIAHLPLAYVNSGDIVLCPDPGYPVYPSSAILADGKPYFMPLKKENGFLPDLQAIPDDVARKAKIMFLNYPNNPTASVAEKDFIKEVIEFCNDRKIVLAHDAAYSEITFDYRARSFLEVGIEGVIEFNSLSKTYNMTGWRIGFAAGCPEVLAGLLKVKTNVDSGVFQAVQEAAIAALTGSDEVIDENNRIYKERRDTLIEGLKEVGLNAEKPKATFYVWCEVPEGYTSMEFTKKLLNDAGILVTPGIGFGEHGEGFVRFALTRDVGVIQEAVERLKGLSL
ncbi:LL-diaminopimelate aminotransferase [Archaeoglobus veneficus]|uniref:Aminotransferase n=1 Tax=Archaeoglobus veneficus (strain DSM 11195 / SNP6) TaxID=693661 RepID=F2KSL6_ARCVS|nr:LL-diaminopimelate aminotransferase [Archaeoglobus veneficus]AEA48086.1 LL-diaminopimelate aminotransferase [Archaeoglobus veneficus SNP6]